MQSDTNPTALCIGLEADELTSDVHAALTPFRCIHYRDVYRALAAIGSEEPTLVIVDVGWLPSVGFEFFEIMARSHPDVALLVSAPTEGDARVRDALARGARSRVTVDAITDCLPRSLAPQPAPLRGEHAVGPIDEISSDTFASAGNVFDAELDERLNAELDAVDEPAVEIPEETRTAVHAADGAPASAVEEEDLDKVDDSDADEDEGAGEPDDDDGPADSRTRVPWLRYDDRPKRTPPQRTPPQRTPPPAAPPAVKPESAVPPRRESPRMAPERVEPSRPKRDEPLLTEEELAALLGPIRGSRE